MVRLPGRWKELEEEVSRSDVWILGFLINVSRYADEVHGVFDDLPRNANDNNNVPLFALIFLMSEDKYSLDLQMRRQPAASSLPNINIHQFLKIFCHLTSFSLALKLRLSGALNHGQNKLRHTHRMNTGILCALAAESATVILSPPRPQRHNPIYRPKVSSVFGRETT